MGIGGILGNSPSVARNGYPESEVSPQGVIDDDPWGAGYDLHP